MLETNIVSAELAQKESTAQEATKTVKAKKEASNVKLVRLIAIGNRGCAMAELSEEQLSAVKRDSKNEIFAKTQRTAGQLIAMRAGRWQNALWADSRSYVSARAEKTFWIGSIEAALSKGLIRKGKAEILNGKKTEKLDVFVAKGDWTKQHYFATEDKLGRIEAGERTHGEKRAKGKCKNALFVRDIQAIEIL